MIAVRFMYQSMHARNQLIPIPVNSVEDAERIVEGLIAAEDPRVPLVFDEIKYFEIKQ